MVSTRAQAEAEENGQQATAGEKHQTELKLEPQPKRSKTENGSSKDKNAVNGQDGHEDEPEEPTKDEIKDEAKRETKQENKSAHTKNGDAVQPSKEKDVPSNVLEKGIVHFYIRGRVNVETPGDVDDVARSYILLRPIPKDAKLGDGTINDAKNTRLLALPKKVIPQSGKDRFMAFVEKTAASYDDIKDKFLAANDYETKTAGTRHTPAATPVGEGVYAITTTGRESHLAYMLSLPEKLGSAQHELGLQEKGSFIISTRNPKYEAPNNARLPKGPEFSQQVQDEFRSLRWMPTKPAHLGFDNAQILLIGESAGIKKAVEPQQGEKGKEEPGEVLDHLGEEDLKRMKHLPGDQSASVFADLEADSKNYPKLQTQF